MAGGWKTGRRFLSACTVLLLVSVGCTRQTPDDDARDGEPLRVTQAGLLPFFTTVWPTIIARDQGFFEQEGLDVSIVWGFEGPQLLAGNQADILLDSSEGGLLLQAQGLDVVGFYPLATHVTVWLLARPEIGSVEDLEGKTVGVSGIPSTDQFLAIEFLEKNGLSAEDVDFVQIDGGLALQALDAGRIDASANIEDFVAQQAAETGDYTVLATGEDFGFFPWTVLQAPRSWIQDNPEGLRGYVEAVYQATRFILDPANKDAVVAAVTEESEGAVDEASVAAAYDTVLEIPDYYPTRPLTLGDVEHAVAALQFSGDLEAPTDVNVGEYLDMRIFEQVVGGG